MVNKAHVGFGLAFYASGERVRDVEGRAVAMTESQIIHDLLRFANADPTELQSFIGQAVVAAERLDAELSALSGTPRTIVADYTRKTGRSLQGWVRQELDKIASGSRVFTRLFKPAPDHTGAALEGPVIFERISPASRLYAFASLEDFAQWALFIACDPERPFAKDFCRCRLPTCGCFFLAQATEGRTRRAYCSTEHLEQAQRQTASERVRASRAGLSLAEWRKRRKHK